jgi:hypothetical protein
MAHVNQFGKMLVAVTAGWQVEGDVMQFFSADDRFLGVVKMRVGDHIAGFELIPKDLLPLDSVGRAECWRGPCRETSNTRSVGTVVMSNDEMSATIEAELKQRLSCARQGGLRIGQLKIPAASTIKGKKYRQVLKRLCAEKQIVNYGTVKRPIYSLWDNFRPVEQASNSLLAHARESGLSLVSLSQFKQCLPPALRSYCADSVAELVNDGRLIEFRWRSQSLYCDPDQVHASRHQADSPDISEVVAQAYNTLVQDRGYPNVLIHDLFTHLHEIKVADLTHYLQSACARGEAIPSEGDWSLSTEEERQSAVSIDGDPYLRIRLLNVA